jgi:glycerate kinase
VVSKGIERKELNIQDPLMREVKCDYLIDKESRTAYIEVANTAGLPMLRKEERNPKMASSIVRKRDI